LIRLSLIEAVRQAWKPLDGTGLTISAHAGDRDRESRGMRFIIRRGEESLCCVKRLPLAGPYDTRAILETQKSYRQLKTVRVPEVLGCTQDSENWFIVEQFVPDGIRLDEAVRLNLTTRDSAQKLVASLLEEIAGTATAAGDAPAFDRLVDEARINAAIDASRIAADAKSGLRRFIFDGLPELSQLPVLTTRDFLPRNILLSDSQPFLVDFDLACRTVLLAMDVLRVEFYTQWQIPFWPAAGGSRDDQRTRLLFLVLEEHLQRTIAGAASSRQWLARHGGQIDELVRAVSGEIPSARPPRPPAEKPAVTIPPPEPLLLDPPPPRLGKVASARRFLRRKIARAVELSPGIAALGSDLIRGRKRRPLSWTSAAGSDIRFHVDGPGDWRFSDQPTIVSGWAFCSTEPIEGIRANVNGEICQGEYGTPRPDVMQALHDEISTPNVGFWVNCPVRRGFNHVMLEVRRRQQWTPLCRSIWRATYFPPSRPGSTLYHDSVQREAHRLHEAAEELSAIASELALQPLISVILPVYRSDLHLLKRAVQSVRGQIYKRWELCIVDDASNVPELSQYLSGLAREPHISVKVRETNGNISAATNDALALARGEWVAFLDHDDELTADALLEVVAAINRFPSADIFYTDQDKVDARQHFFEPFFKPDFSPTYLRGVMYLGHLLVARRRLVNDVGGCDSRFDGVQDFELALRLSERTGRVHHIPRVLYHWRSIAGSIASSGSAKSNIDQLQESAVQAHLDRIGFAATARRRGSSHRVLLIPKPRQFYPKISILIPTRDHPELIGRCLKTLFEKTAYPNFEVLIGDNETRDPQALKIIDSYPVRKIPLSGGFHFARFNNVLAAEAGGEFLMLLNNDTEIVQSDWLEHLLLHADDPAVGAAGALLTYSDGAVQHAGIILGPRGTADHLMRGFPADVDGYMGSLLCTREVTAVTAAAMLVHRRKFLLVGGLCERYQRHYDDLDFCLRLRARGLRNIFVSTARLIHHESRSRGSKYDFTDRILLLDRWESLIDRGDEYYSRNFSRNSTDYSVDSGGFPQ
jgi:GT2 family glycosyltransferase